MVHLNQKNNDVLSDMERCSNELFQVEEQMKQLEEQVRLLTNRRADLVQSNMRKEATLEANRNQIRVQNEFLQAKRTHLDLWLNI